MTKGLVDRPGKWRNCNVGVFNAQRLAFPGGEVKPCPAYKPTGLAWLLDRMFERAKEIAAA